MPVLGTQPEAIDLAEHRGAFGRVLAEAGPAGAASTAPRSSFDEAKAVADAIGYPVLVRPSYVLGGRGMEIVYDERAPVRLHRRATEITADHPVLVDRFLDDAIEIDVDALYDGTELYLGGVMEHIEEAGIHSGDSACALPPITLGARDIAAVRASTLAIAQGVGVRGLLNVQYALAGDVLYVLEANPRASRTVPFVSKATAVPLAKAAARIALGATIAELRAEGLLPRSGDGGDLPRDAPIAVKEAVLPFHRFRTPGGDQVDSILGPEMKSTGEVMGFDADFGTAFAKSQAAAYGLAADQGHGVRQHRQPGQAGGDLPGQAAVRPGLPRSWRPRARRRCCAATASTPRSSASSATGPGNVVERILAGEVDLVLNTPWGAGRAARGRLRDPHRGGAGRHPVPDHGAGARRRGAGHRGDGRAARSASARCRIARNWPTGGPARGRGHASTAAWRGRRPSTAPVQDDAARSSPCSRVGAYVQFTVVAPGIASGAQPGPVRRGRGRRREHRRCCCAARSRCTARRRRGEFAGTIQFVVAEHGRAPLAGNRSGRRPARRRRPARAAVPAPAGAGAGRAGRRRLRHRAADPARRALLAQRLAGRDGARRRHRGPAVRRTGGQAADRRGRP